MEENRQNLEQRMDRIIEWVKACDNKASILLSIDALIITILLAGDYFMNGIRTTISTVISEDYSSVTFSGTTAVVCLIVSIICLLVSLYYCLKVVGAKTEESQTGASGVHKESLIHFHHISKLSFEDFVAQMTTEDEDKYLKDLYSQIYINAVRCNEKFNDYNAAVNAIRIAIPFALGYIVFITIFLATIIPVLN